MLQVRIQRELRFGQNVEQDYTMGEKKETNNDEMRKYIMQRGNKVDKTERLYA